MKKVLLSIVMLCIAVSAIAQTSEEVKIQGDHGMLAAVIQKPKMADGEKAHLVVLCHGFTSNKENNLICNIADSLQAKGVASIRFDFNGHGKSEGRFEDMTVANEIEDAKRVVAYAMQQPWVQDVSIIGHSQGGVVASMVAGQLKGGIRKVGLCAAAACLRDDALQGQLMGNTYNAGNIPETVALPYGGLKIGRAYVEVAQTLPIYETALQYEGPVIIVHGTADRIVPYTYSERFKYGYKNAELYLLPGVDHSFTTPQSAQHAASLVSSFIAK